MDNINRRDFIGKSLVVGGVSLVAPSILKLSQAMATQKMIKDDISIAQWALVNEIRSGKWKTLDFPGLQGRILT